MQVMLKQSAAPVPKSTNTVLSVTGLSGGPIELPLFRDFNLQLPAGLSALLGDEGSGKTSLMRLLSGDLEPTAGQLRLMCEATPLALPRHSAVFWTDLRLPLNDSDTPAQCWAHFRLSLPAWSNATQDELVETLQLAPHLDKRLNMLSTGCRRKVGLVAALASGAKVTLLHPARLADRRLRKARLSAAGIGAPALRTGDGSACPCGGHGAQKNGPHADTQSWAGLSGPHEP